MGNHGMGNHGMSNQGMGSRRASSRQVTFAFWCSGSKCKRCNEMKHQDEGGQTPDWEMKWLFHT